MNELFKPDDFKECIELNAFYWRQVAENICKVANDKHYIELDIIIREVQVLRAQLDEAKKGFEAIIEDSSNGNSIASKFLDKLK